MKITASRAELAAAAKWTARAITPGMSFPAMLGMIIRADDQGVHLLASNYDATHRAKVSAEVGEPGSVLVPGLSVATLLGALRGTTVEVETEGDELVIRSGVTSSRFRTLTLELYPNLPEAPESGPFTVDAEVLADAVSRLGGLSSRDRSGQPWQEAVHLLIADGVQITCGSRYAMGRTTIEATTGDKQDEVLTPTKLLGSALSDLAGDVFLSTQGGSLHLVAGDRAATIRLFDDTYPKVDALLHPQGEGRLKIRIDRDALLETVRLVATSTDILRLEFTSGQLVVSSTTPKKGEARSEITDVIACEGEGSGDVIAAVDFLTQCLNALTDEEIEISLPERGLAMNLRDDANAVVLQTIKPREN